MTTPIYEPHDDLEPWLPPDIQKAVREYLEGERETVSYLDCLWCELYGSINANQWGGRITIEQADYLRGKYLYDTDDDE